MRQETTKTAKTTTTTKLEARDLASSFEMRKACIVGQYELVPEATIAFPTANRTNVK